MLTVRDIDDIMIRLAKGEEVFIYYVANLLETREGLLDEHFYKSESKFKVVRVKVTGITNAYLEYVKYHKDEQKEDHYHVETEVCYYEPTKRYTHFYTVPNDTGSSDKPFVARMPSLIYGIRREIFDTQTLQIEQISDITPLKPMYTNNLCYGDQIASCYGSTDKATEEEIKKAEQFVIDNNLQWKYLKLEPTEFIDGIEYYYLTSNSWILDIEDFPRTEKPLINNDEKCAYFMTTVEAFNYIDQLLA